MASNIKGIALRQTKAENIRYAMVLATADLTRLPMKGIPFKAVLCSENALFREGLIRILSEVDANIVSSDKFFLDSAPSLLRDESHLLLIVDASDDFDAAISQIEYAKLNYQNARGVVLVSRHQLQLTKMILAFRSGASAYLTTFMTPDAFVKSLELVMLGETIFPITMLTYLDQELNRSRHGNDHQDDHGMNKNDIEHHQEESGYSDGNDATKEASRGIESDFIPHLSARQTAILRCLLDGHPNKVIARKMKIADATVKVHIKTILRKIRVENRTQAALWAMRNIPSITSGHNCASATNNFRYNGDSIQQRVELDNLGHPYGLETERDKSRVIPNLARSEWDASHQKSA